MFSFDPQLEPYCLAAVLFVGLVGACVARLGEGSLRQTPCQCVFLCCMALVGAAALASACVGPGACLTSGTTLAVMVLGATYDFGTTAR